MDRFLFSSAHVLVSGQAVLPDPHPEKASPSHGYYSNRGQLISDGTPSVASGLMYYTERSMPQIYLGNDRVSFVVNLKAPAMDSVLLTCRFDLGFECSSLASGSPGPFCPLTLHPFEQTHDHLNYYLPHCPEGITEVPGYQRIVAENVYPGIDCHFYSNSAGFKSYLVIRPEGQANALKLRFNGPDSLRCSDASRLELYASGFHLDMPLAYAYTVDKTNTSKSVKWKPGWVVNADGSVSLSTGPYDRTETLVIVTGISESHFSGKSDTEGNLAWSTFYGGNNQENVEDVQISNSDEIYVLEETNSNIFPVKLGAQLKFGGQRDVYVSKFDAFFQRTWATYYGGSYSEYPAKLDLYKELVFVVGTTHNAPDGTTNDFPIPSPNNGSFKQLVTGGGQTDAFLFSLTSSEGKADWATYFGGEGSDYGLTVDIVRETDISTGRVVIGGATGSRKFTSGCSPEAGAFPVCKNGNYIYNQTWNNGNNGFDGFIAEFDRENKSLLWSTLLGGNGNDYILDIKSDQGKSLVFCGKTHSTAFPATTGSPQLPNRNGQFPLSNPGNGAYFQSRKNAISDPDGFVGSFSVKRELTWNTLFGGEGGDAFVSVETTPGSIYVLGSTETRSSASSCVATASGAIPICNANSVSYSSSTLGGSRDNLVAKFGLAGKDLQWSTYLGGPGTEGSDPNADLYEVYGDLVSLTNSSATYLFVSSASDRSIPVLQNLFFYQQDENASAQDPQPSQDGTLYCFTDQNALYWATHFGGGCKCTSATPLEANEVISGLAVNRNYLVVGGETGALNSTTPQKCPDLPGKNPYCDAGINGSADGFISAFNLKNAHLGIEPGTSHRPDLLPYTVFPVPGNGRFQITGQSEFRTISRIDLLSQDAGVLLKQLLPSANTEILSLDLSYLNPGMYFLRITDQFGTYVCKIIVQ